MARSIKLQNNDYWDSSGITHNQKKLNELLDSINTSLLKLQKEKGYISINLSANTNHVVSTAWEQKNILFDNIKNTNEIFELEENCVIIPDGITRIRVCGQAMVRGITGTMIATIYHNNTAIVSGYYTSPSTGSWDVISLEPYILKVKPGDKIGLRYSAGTTGTIIIAGAGFTLLSIEEF